MPRAVIIEDNFVVALELEVILKDLGVEVCATASSQEEAAEALAQHRPDLVTCDLHLRDGEIQTERLLADFPSTCIIYVTAASSGLRADIDPEHCVDKPFNAAMVKRAIEAVFAEQRAEQ